jgi:lysozyme family protein
MADFLPAYDITLGHEGGYSNHPHDAGGETWKGIARSSWPKWEGWYFVDVAKAQEGFPGSLQRHARLDELVQTFYEKNFWKKLMLDQIDSQRVANELFDTAVNMGSGTAIKMLQEACNLLNRNGRDFPDLNVDGIMGAKTLWASRNANERKLFNTLNILQGERYIEICRKNPTQEVFFNGWLNRIEIM